jgi:modification methylase
MPSPLPRNQVVQGESVEALASLPENSVDLIFADPPYNLQLHKDLWRPNISRVRQVDDDWDQFDDDAAYAEFTRAWLRACRRVLKDEGTLWVIGSYHNIHRVGVLLRELDFWTLNSVVWIKTNPTPNFHGMRFTNAHETLLWVQKHRGAKYTFNYNAMKGLNGDLQMRSDWLLPTCVGPERIKLNGARAHNTQKPEALLYRVITASSNPGDLVLDPFFGTGTTGAVAKKLHRDWIGIEQDPEYVQIARERIAAIEPGAYDERIFMTPEPRRRARIAFGRLLEEGYLQPGDPLFYQADVETQALVLADGTLEYNGTVGTIHTLPRKLFNTPVNGWEVWFFEKDGQHHKLDELRVELRQRERTQSENLH